MRLKLIVWLGAGILGLALYLVFRPAPPQESAEVTENSSSHPVPAMPQSEPRAEARWQPPTLLANDYESEYGPLPKSLRDTRIPFDVRVDDQNHLIVEFSLRRLFDYFFTLVGEEEIDQIKARIQELLQRYLPEPAASEAIAIFLEYVKLKEAELDLRNQMSADYSLSGQQVDLRERVRLLRELRQSTLSPAVYDAFYGEEDKRALYSLQRHEVLTDKSLTLDERNAALRELDQALPASLREAKEEEYRYEELQQTLLQGQENGLSEEDIFQLRSDAYGPEVAERFAEADQRQAEWDKRLSDYRQQRRAIIDSGLSEADQQAEIERLRQQHFAGPELMRIPVIDGMYDTEGRL